MSTGEKGESKVEQLRGKFKEAVGKVTGNERMKSEGRGEQTKGHAREAKENVKDTARGFTEGLRGDSHTSRGPGPGPGPGHDRGAPGGPGTERR